MYWLHLAGVDHAEQRVSFSVTSGSVELDGRLGTYQRPFGGGDLPVRVRYVDANGNAGDAQDGVAKPIQGRKQVYELELAPPAGATAVQYQLVTPSGRSFNGPAAQRWVYDGGGDYWSERDLAGHTKLELSLDELAPAGLWPQLEFHGEHVVRSREQEGRALLDASIEQLRKGLADQNQDRQAACAVVHTVAADARTKVEALDDTELRVYAALAWGSLFGQFAHAERECLSAGDLYWLLELVPADHIAWCFHGLQIDSVFGAVLDDSKVIEFRRQLATVQTDPAWHRVRAQSWWLETASKGALGFDIQARCHPLRTSSRALSTIAHQRVLSRGH